MTRIQIGYNPSSLFNALDILKFAKSLDTISNVNSIWMPESWGREAFVMLGAISALTKRIQLGTSVVSIFARSPATAAMAACTLDHISSNRTIIGFGASTPVLAENWHGIRFEHPLQRIKEYVDCFNAITSREITNYDGKYFKLKNIKIMHPTSRKKIPIFLGAVNSGMVKLSTEIADGIILYLRPIDELRKTVEFIKSIVDKSRRKFEISSVFIMSVSNKNPNLARKRVAKTLAFYVCVGKYYNKFLASHGFEKEVREITMEYKRHGIESAKNLVTKSMLDSLTIYGTIDDCKRSLKHFISSGISFPILQINPLSETDTEQSIKDSLLLAEVV